MYLVVHAPGWKRGTGKGVGGKLKFCKKYQNKVYTDCAQWGHTY